MKVIFHYLRPYRLRMAAGLSVKFIGTVMDLLLPWILAYILDTVVPQKNEKQIWFFGFIMVVCAVIALVGNVVANRMAALVAKNATQTLRHDLYKKSGQLSCRQMDAFTIPSLISRMTSDTYHIHQFINMTQRMGVRAPILLIGGLIVTLTLDPLLSLVMIATLPFIGLVVWFISKKGVPLYTKQQQKSDHMVQMVRENYQGIRVIKALSKEEYEKGKFNKVNKELGAQEQKSGMIMSITNPSVTLLLNLGMAMVIIVGAYAVNEGVSQPGKIIAFMSYFTIISTAMMTITRIFVMYSKGLASAKRIAEVLEAPDELKVLDIAPTQTEAFIRFENVSFSYYGETNSRYMVQDISFELGKGETLGIIGTIGSGKTTLIQLLLRFYDVSKGSIRIEGRDIRSFDPGELRRKFGVVFQNDYLSADSIADNISFDRNIDPEQMAFATQIAQADEFINQLEDGYDHCLDAKGGNFSGGQRQRILISRSLADNPEILILDDSSSALDYATDAALRKGIRHHLQQTTCIIVAQRISSIKHANRILVLEHGKIAGLGDHDTLMKDCEIYRQISKSQMREFTE